MTFLILLLIEFLLKLEINLSYTGISNYDKELMLKEINISNIEKLFKDIPSSIFKKNKLSLAESISEQEAEEKLQNISKNNKTNYSFLGAGCYRHYIPALVDHLSSRSEFYTAYTPYQPEVSQGTLTAIFEFQSLICRLTGMPVANASLYDGATAAAEAVLMSVRTNNKKKIIVSNAIHPHYNEVVQTYCWANGIEIEKVEIENGVTDLKKIKENINENISSVVVQSPNFFGCIEDIKSLAEEAHLYKANLILIINEPFSMGLLQKAALLNVDIVCGEASSFGNPISFGGPGLGFLAAQKNFMRKMPGRLVGKTKDSNEKDCFVLTLQTREQHIRRERATSNICTNQGLCALRSTIFLSLIGNNLKDLAKQNHILASYLKNELLRIGFQNVFDSPFFNEFVLKIENANLVLKKLEAKGFSLGINLENYYKEYKDCILICTTELNTEKQIQLLIEELKTVL